MTSCQDIRNLSRSALVKKCMQMKDHVGDIRCNGKSQELVQTLCAFLTSSSARTSRLDAFDTAPVVLPPTVAASKPQFDLPPVDPPRPYDHPPEVLDVVQRAPVTLSAPSPPFPVPDQHILQINILETKLFYFVYGAATHNEIMRRTNNLDVRKPELATATGYGLYFAGRSSKWGGAVASIALQSGSVGVPGSLYTLSGTELERLEKFKTLSVRREIEVTKDGARIKAVTHIPIYTQWIVMPSPQYIAAMQIQRDGVNIEEPIVIVDQFGIPRGY